MNPDGDENQNKPDTTSDAANSAQQAIFTPASAPQPPRPTSSQPVITGSVVEPASTGLSHQYYSNHPTKTSASGVGDIVIGNGKTQIKSKKKALIVGGVAIGLLFIIAIAVIVIANLSTPRINKVRQSFNKFANYMIYGDDSLSDLTETYQYGSQYYINHLSSDSERRDFLILAQEKFDQFYNEYSKSIDSKKEEGTDESANSSDTETNEASSIEGELLTILNSYRSDLSMAVYTQSSPILSANEIMLYYIEDLETAESEIRKYYDANDTSDEVLAHAEQNIQDANSLLLAYRVFSQNGCISESGSINNTCLIAGGTSLASANQVVEDYNTMFSVISAENYERSIRLYQNIWVIQEKLNEEN